MAFLVIGAIHQAIRGVQSGIQAHKDFQNPVQVVDPNSPTTANPPLDRYGHAKERHPVYGWVMKAEHKFNKGKRRAVPVSEQESGPSRQRDSGARERVPNKEEYDKQQYDSTPQSVENIQGVRDTCPMVIICLILTNRRLHQHMRLLSPAVRL